MVLELLEREGISPAELDAIAVSRGPGSFTGIRIGMATAKGLAQIWNKPVIEVPTLESFAFSDLAASGRYLMCPLFDARRDQVYAGAYRACRRDDAHDDPMTDFGRAESVIPGSACSLGDFLEKAAAALQPEETAVFCGDGADAFAERLAEFKGPFIFAQGSERYQQAVFTARLAAVIGPTADAFTAKPEYMRLAEAERKLRERT